MTVTMQDVQRRELMDRFIQRTEWSLVLRDAAEKRWGAGGVTVRIAERGTFRDIPVKGWTHTDSGTIFMREEIFDGFDLEDPAVLAAVNATVQMLVIGKPINPKALRHQIEERSLYLTPDKIDLVWRVAQTVVANYGVFGHEYSHAAYSEHTGRHAWQMALEDLRIESLWMAQDPIRARQGLRACASFWVTHDASPMAGEQTFDVSKVRTHASLLHLYLLVVGRGRIGVLDDQSSLVVGVRDLAEDVLGWEVVSEADDIIDRFLETDEDPDDEYGAAERAALAEEFANLLPKAAGLPNDGIGCHCDPKQEAPKPDNGAPSQSDEQQQQGEGEGEGDGGESDEDDTDQSGNQGGQEADQDDEQDQGGSQDQGGQDGQESGQDGDGGGDTDDTDDTDQGDQDGDSTGSGQSGSDQDETETETDEGGGSGQGEQGDEPDQDEEASEQASGADDSDDDSDDSDETPGEGDGDQDGDGEADDTDDTDGEDDGDRDLTIGTNTGDASDGDAESVEKDDHIDFETGQFGETIQHGTEEVSDELDESDAFRLTEEEVKALAEVLAEGLEEVNDSESAAGWSISDEAGVILTSQSTSPAKVSSEVFSRQALTTRNRRARVR